MQLIAPHFPGYYNIIPNGVDVDLFSRPAQRIPELDDGKTNEALAIFRYEGLACGVIQQRPVLLRSDFIEHVLGDIRGDAAGRIGV